MRLKNEVYEKGELRCQNKNFHHPCLYDEIRDAKSIQPNRLPLWIVLGRQPETDAKATTGVVRDTILPPFPLLSGCNQQVSTYHPSERWQDESLPLATPHAVDLVCEMDEVSVARCEWRIDERRPRLGLASFAVDSTRF